jgi:hypothetical protein
MPSSFKPPARNSLAKVDVAKGVSYEKQGRIVEGVVSPCGMSGWTGDGYGVHCFSLADWRLAGGSLVGRKLIVLRPVPLPREGGPFDSGAFKEIPAYSIQRFSVLLSKDHQRAVVEKVFAANRRDKTLRQLAERLQEPVVVSTCDFGDLALNRELDWFEGKANWNRKEVKLHLERDADGGIAGALRTAESLWADQASWQGKVEEIAVERLLELKNEDWLGEGEGPLTPAAFTKQMRLQSIHVDGEGQIQFWDDGSMFGAHAIQISGTLREGLTDVDVC